MPDNYARERTQDAAIARLQGKTVEWHRISNYGDGFFLTPNDDVDPEPLVLDAPELLSAGDEPSTYTHSVVPFYSCQVAEVQKIAALLGTDTVSELAKRISELE